MGDRCSVIAAGNPATATLTRRSTKMVVALFEQSNFYSRLLPSLLLTSKELLTGGLKVQRTLVATEIKKILSRKRRTV